jgi:hypothetical protein
MSRFTPIIVMMAAVQGLVGIGLLLLLQAIMSAFAPGWTLPFTALWGLLLGVPALAAALFARGR